MNRNNPIKRPLKRSLFLLFILGVTLTPVMLFAQKASNSVQTTSIAKIRSMTNPQANVVYQTKDYNNVAQWQLDLSDKSSADNTGTVLVTKDGRRMKRIYSGAVHTQWFGLPSTPGTNLTELRYIFNNFRDIYVDAGQYKIDPVVGAVIPVQSNTNASFSPQSTFQINPNNLGDQATQYFLFSMDNVKQINFSGLTVIGDRNNHNGKKGEWGAAIGISNPSSNITLSQLNISEMWGDGISMTTGNIRKKGDAQYVPNNITISDFTINHCRRNGISITAGDNILISNGHLSNQDGTAPKAGIDLEIGYWGVVDHIRLKDLEVNGNVGGGVIGHAHSGHVIYDHLNIHDNGSFGLTIRQIDAPQSVINCTLQNNTNGIYVYQTKFPVTINSTTIIGANKTLMGVYIKGAENPISISKLKVENTKHYGIQIDQAKAVSITDCSFQKTGNVTISSKDCGKLTVQQSSLAGGSRGLGVSGASNMVVVSNNQIVNNNIYNLSIDSLKSKNYQVNVNNNTFQGSKNGVTLKSTVSFTGNKVFGCQQSGIILNSGSDGSKLDQNTIYDNGYEGLTIYSANNQITGNEIYANSGKRSANGTNIAIFKGGNTIKNNQLSLGTNVKKPSYNIEQNGTRNQISGNSIKEDAGSIK